MNRETKIGLITGLTLIVLIGALLSSYLSRSPKNNPTADYGTLGQSMRKDLLNPPGIAYVPLPAPATNPAVPDAVAGGASSPAGAPVVGDPAIPMNRDSAVTSVPIAGANTQPSGPMTAAAPSADGISTGSLPTVGGQNAMVSSLPDSVERSGQVYVEPTVTPATADSAGGASAIPNLKSQRRKHHITGDASLADANVNQDGATGQPAAGTRLVYTVKRGDTLGRIARHFYHESGPVAIRRIVAANRGRLASARSMLRIGETLRIPNAGKSSDLPLMRLDAYADSGHTAETGTRVTRKLSHTTHARHTVVDASLADAHIMRHGASHKISRHTHGTKLYRVKSGDNLYALARHFLGSGSRSSIHRIMRLNHLSDPRMLRVGMELRIPAANSR